MRRIGDGPPCGAVAAADGRCLAHLDAEARTAYLADLRPGSDVDARGVAFTEDLLADLLNALRDDDGVARFGDARFVGATFSGDAEFHGARFSKDVMFNQATFSGRAGFGQVRFSGYAGFDGTTFSEIAWFEETTLSGDADFTLTTFSANAIFDTSEFAGDLTVTGRVSGRLTLVGAVARRKLALTVAAAEVSAARLRADGHVHLRLRAARVDVTEAVCAGPLTVQGLQRPIDGVDETPLKDPDTGAVPPVTVRSLRGVDAGSLVLTDVDLSSCLFTGLHRADQVHLDGRCLFAADPGGRRRVLVEEHYWRALRRQRQGRPLKGWSAAPPDVEVVGSERLEVLYRQLRKALEDGKNEPGAADFYYGEMEMRRLGERGRRTVLPRFGEQRRTWPAHVGEKLLLTLYWLVSGYGLRAGRALLALVVVVAALAAAMKYAGFADKQVSYLDALLHSLRSATAVSVTSATGSESVTRWGQVYQIPLRIAGPLFVALAALAIRNRVKR